MYNLQRFHGPRFDRLNAIIDSMGGHITSYVSLIGSGTLPLPEVCRMEGLPGAACRVEGHRDSRLFPGTDPIDEAEALIEEEIRRLFELDDAYGVSGQPHSATQANHAVFRAVLGDSRAPVIGLSPADGGHISHCLGAPGGSQFIPFPLDGEVIDFDELEMVVRRLHPAILVAGGTSYTRAIDYERLREIANHVDGHLHADLAHTAPFVAAGEHPSAFPYCDSATLDLSKNLRGPRGGILIYRDEDASEMRRAIFPLLQSSPNQSGLLAKAACLNYWSGESLRAYTKRMVHLADVLSERLERYLDTPVFGGTDTHLLLFNLSAQSIDGREAEVALEKARILVNRNQIPGDAKSPWAPSGIRLGTTVLAILEYAEQDVQALGDVIGSVLCGRSAHSGTIERLLDTYHRPLVSIASE